MLIERTTYEDGTVVDQMQAGDTVIKSSVIVPGNSGEVVTVEIIEAENFDANPDGSV